MPAETRSERRRDLRRLLAFALSASALTYYALRGGSTDIVVRQTEAIVTWFIVGAGFAFGVLPRGRPPRLAAIPFIAFLLLAGWTALSLTWTDSSERTFAELARVLAYAGVITLVWSLVDGTTWRAAAAGLAAGALLVCALSVASRLAPDAFPRDYIQSLFHTDRSNYPLQYWNAVAAWGAISIAMALSFSAHAHRLWARMAFLAAVPIAGLAVYLTYSRAGAAGVVLALGAAFVLGRNRWVVLAHALVAAGVAAAAIAVVRAHPGLAHATGNAGASTVVLVLVAGAAVCAAAVAATWFARGDDRWRMPERAGRIAAALGIALALVAAGTVARAPIAKGWKQFTKSEAPATKGTQRLSNLGGTRHDLWSSALDAFDAHPIEGTGAGTFEFWWNRHRGKEFVRDAHSLYLESMGELGLPGLLLVLTALLSLGVLPFLAKPGLRRTRSIGARSAMAAGFVVFLFHAGVDWMWESTAVTVLALAGVAVAAGARSARRWRPPLWFRVAIPVLAVVAIAIQAPGLQATRHVRASQAAVRDGLLDKAATEADDAVDAEPWAASPYVQRALVAEREGFYEAARGDLKQATDREPDDWRAHLLLARVDVEAGHPHEALEAYARAKQLRPKSAFFPPLRKRR